MDFDRSRLPATLSRKQRATRVLSVLEAWALIGVVAYAMPVAQQDELIADLRDGRWHRSSERLAVSDDVLPRLLDAYVGRRDKVVVVGRYIVDEPAILLSFDALKRSVRHLPVLYPDGFVVVDQAVSAVLTIAIDAADPGGIRVERLTFDTQR